jgi:hypothetical protein
MFLFILLFLVKSVGKVGLFCGILKFEKIFRGWINTINKVFTFHIQIFLSIEGCIVLPELQRFYGRAIVIITPVEMPISDINRPLSIIIFVLNLSVYRVVLGRIYD